MYHRRILLAIIVAVPFLAVANDVKSDEAPKSPLAVAAMGKHEKAIARAREAMLRAIVESDQQLLHDLDAALATAMQNKNADEVVRLTSAKRAAQSSLKQHTDEAALNVAASPGLPSIAGTWNIKYTNGFVRTYVINTSGDVSFPAEKLSGQLKATKEGGWLLDFGDGRLEILRFKLSIDHFNPRSSYPDKPPASTGGAERAKDEVRPGQK